MATPVPWRWLGLLISLWLVSGCSQEAPPPAQKAAALTPAEIRTIKFERLSDWHRVSGTGTLSSSTRHSEGQRSLALSGMGYVAVRNLTPLTKDDQQTPVVVGYDIWIPRQQPNPYWHGDTQLSIDAPSAGVYRQYLGYRSLQNLPKGQWVRVEFSVPARIRQALDAAQYTDLRFLIVVNVAPGSQTHYLDNFTLGPAETSCTPTDDNNPCTSDTCNPATGQTTHTPVAPGTSCSDANECNGAELCDATGVCQAGTVPVIDDGNVCTTDGCTPSGGVTHTPVAPGTTCGDSNACNGAELCNEAGACAPGTPPTIDDGNSCTSDSCHPSAGVGHVPLGDGTSCSDGNACTTVDVCSGGVCAAGAPLDVDDADPCTSDGCDPITGAIGHEPLPAGSSCADGDLCNGLETCDAAGACLAGTPPRPPADDGDPCTVESCDPTSGYVTETCTVIDAGVTTTTFAATTWIFTGEHPLQVGVEQGTIDATRAALLRGQVTTSTGDPLPGVKVSIHGHDEYGYTRTQGNGWFDLVVNGGGPLVLDYAAEGHLPVQRRTSPAWNGSDVLPTVVLLPLDPAETIIDLNAETPQLVVGSTVEDDAGARQPVILVAPGVEARLELPDGSTQPVSELHVRITEYTVGPQGHLAMPADLPPTSAYTHAFEVSTEEAHDAGATSVTFSEPVVYYIDNYLDFPVGWPVPNGYYDHDRATWVATETGVVIEVLDVSGPEADVNVDGDPEADVGAELAALGISQAELEELAASYEQGAQLWRVRLPHLSTWDSNQGNGPPDGAGGPNAGNASGSDDSDNGNECPAASRVDVANQIYRESIPIAGTDRNLVYSSARAEGAAFRRELRIPLTDATPPAPLKAVEALVTVAGRQFGPYRFGPAPNQVWTFQWDGLDAYGRRLQGPQPYVAEVRFVYDAVYLPAEQLAAYPYKIPGLQSIPAQRELFFSHESRGLLSAWTAEGIGLGGWTLEGHDTRDLISGTIERGDGTSSKVNAGAIAERIDRPWPEGVSGTMYPAYGIGPDGSVYSGAQVGPFAVILRTTRDGVSEVVTGNGSTPNLTDGMLAVDAQLGWPNNSDMVVAPDGTVYFERFEDFVYRIDQDGRLWRVAGGTTNQGPNLDGVPALEADFTIEYFAVSPAGRMYVSTRNPSDRVYEIDPNGILRAITGNACQNPMGGPVDAINTCGRAWFMAVGKDETLYVGDRFRVYKIDAAGKMTWLAGGGSMPPIDGLPAKDAALNFLLLAVSDEGEILVNHGDSLLAIGADGLIKVIYDASKKSVQTGVTTGIPVQTLDLRLTFEQGWNATHMLAAPNGIIVPTRPDNEIYLLNSAVPQFSLTQTVAGSPDGSEYQVFDAFGRLQQRNNRLLNTTLESYGYDAAGRLAYIENPFGRRTLIERDASGQPTAIVAPYGQRTELAVDEDGLLESVTPPGSPPYLITYHPGGLLSTFQDPTGGTSVVEFDQDGRLTLDEDSVGGFLSLARTDGEDGSWSVQMTNAEGGGLEDAVLLSGSGPTSSDSAESTYSDGLTSSADSRRSEHTRVLRDGTEVTSRTRADPAFGTESPLYKRSTLLPTSSLTNTVETSRSVAFATSGELQTLTNTECVASGASNLCEAGVESASSQERTITSPAGRVTKEVFDDLGRPHLVQAPGTALLRMTYDEDKVTTITLDPDGVPSSGDERSTQMLYDVSGRLTSVTDPLTHTTYFGDFDLADRPQTITLPDTSEVGMTYDVMGNVASVTPPGKATHAMTYGLRGRIESYTPPVGNTVAYEYDLARHVDRIDFDGPDEEIAHVDFVWDGPSGQLETVTSPSGTIDVSYTLGKITSLVASSASGPITTSLAYDGPLPTDLSWSGPISGQVHWTYNDRFLVQTETIGALPSTATVYAYDNDGLVTHAGALAVARDAASGRVTTKTLGNVRETYQYNTFGELSRQTVQRMSGSTVVETLYDVIYDDGPSGARDALGRITKKTEWIVEGDAPISGPRPLTSREYDYGYNPDGRPWLESVAVDGIVVSRYAYDENGNRTSAELGWSQLGYSTEFDASLNDTDTNYNEADQLLTSGSREYTWNAFGQLEAMLDTATQEETVYEYDLYGNLLSVATPDGRTIQYDVDGAGRRVGRRVLDVQGIELDYRAWIYRDLLRPIAEVNASGNVVARYVYLDGEGSRQNGMHQLATRLGANQDTSLPFAGSNVPEYIELLDDSGTVAQTLRLIVNQVGTVQAVVDVATGDIVQRLEHDEFGRVLFDSNPGLQPFGFAGGLVDADTALVRFGARDYEPVTGRWTARDPVRFAALETNRYSYSAGDAVNYLDPAGAIPTAIAGAAAGALVGGLGALAGVAGAGVAAGLAGECGPSLDDFVKAGIGGALGGAIAGFNVGTGGAGGILAGGLIKVIGGGVGGFVGGGVIYF